LDSMRSDGVFWGATGTAGQLIIGDMAGTHGARTVRSRPEEERWPTESAEVIVGVPWRHDDEDPSMDGEKMEAINMTEEEP
jgi:hypothetical protein